MSMALNTSNSQATGRFAFGLAPSDVEEFRALLQEEGGETISLDDAWSRAIEVLALCRMLLGPLPDDPSIPG